MVACGTLNYCGQAFFVGAVNPNSALLVLTSDGDVDLLDAHSESTGQAFLASSMDKEIIVSSLTGIRCSVSESHGASLGSVRKVMSQTPHCTSQRDHCRITSCKLVEARNDAAVFFQPAEHTLDDVALPILGSIKEPRQPRFWFALHDAQRNHRLHPITVAIAA